MAALSPWHGAHDVSRAAVEERRPLLPAHVLLESYATLTRIPGHELAPALVARVLAASFPGRRPTLTGSAYARLIDGLSAAGIAGGRVYDALVGAASKAAGATLLTRDRRAGVVYQLLGCPFELV